MYFLARAWDDDERKSDTGSARRLVALFGDDIRFSPSRGWLIWDGARWRHDELGDLPELAKLVARAWRDDADLIARTAAFAQSDAELEAILGRSAGLAGWARSCESKTRLQSMLKVAETMPGVALAAARLDARPWLLNVANGTLDLRSAELRPHSREDLLTVVVPVEYRPGARLQLWDNFLASATGGDSDLQDFMQRAAGYSLTGYTGEEVLFFVYGPAGSGKSTFVEAMRSVLGTYARSADFESFIKKTGGRGIPNDIAALSAARLVAAIEVDAGKEMAAAVVKQLTGGDTVPARFLFNEFFEFKPEFKLWLVANDAPVIDASDSGLARRIRVVPLTNAVPGDDQVSWVKDLLTSPLAGPAILAWMVEGCLKFQSDGLGSAAAVDRANAEYSESMDDVGHFIEECCLVESGHFTSTADLFQVYRAWANGNGMTILTGNALGRTLTKKGFVKGKKRDKRGWSGLGLRPVSVDIQWDGYRDVSNPPVMPALPSG
jgi:putative DNA primase/helicase